MPPSRPQNQTLPAPGETSGIIQNESGGNPHAKNPRSSATGLGQFLAGTWLDVIRKHRPDLLAGRSREDILALRTDPDLSRAMTDAYAADNAAELRRAGLPTTPGNIYLAHFAGLGGARRILKADPNTPVEAILGPDVMKANPSLIGKTAADMQAWADHKMASGGTAPRTRVPPATPRAAWPSGSASPMQYMPPAEPREPTHPDWHDKDLWTPEGLPGWAQTRGQSQDPLGGFAHARPGAPVWPRAPFAPTSRMPQTAPLEPAYPNWRDRGGWPMQGMPSWMEAPSGNPLATFPDRAGSMPVHQPPARQGAIQQPALPPENLTAQALRMKGASVADISGAMNDPQKMNELIIRHYGPDPMVASDSGSWKLESGISQDTSSYQPRQETTAADSYLPFGWAGLKGFVR